MQKLNNLEWGLKEKMQWEGKKDAVYYLVITG